MASSGVTISLYDNQIMAHHSAHGFGVSFPLRLKCQVRGSLLVSVMSPMACLRSHDDLVRLAVAVN